MSPCVPCTAAAGGQGWKIPELPFRLFLFSTFPNSSHHRKHNEWRRLLRQGFECLSSQVNSALLPLKPPSQHLAAHHCKCSQDTRKQVTLCITSDNTAAVADTDGDFGVKFYLGSHGVQAGVLAKADLEVENTFPPSPLLPSSNWQLLPSSPQSNWPQRLSRGKHSPL